MPSNEAGSAYWPAKWTTAGLTARPRLRQLLDALADVPADVDGVGDYRFVWPGPDGSRRLRLDEIPLQSTVEVG